MFILSGGYVLTLLGFRFCNCAVTVALFIAILLSVEKNGQAQIVDWTNTTGTPDPWYHDGMNWSGGNIPGPNQTANFDQAATYEVWWNNSLELRVGIAGNGNRKGHAMRVIWDVPEFVAATFLRTGYVKPACHFQVAFCMF